MYRVPQAFLISLSLHLVVGVSILLFVVPKIKYAEPDSAVRCSISLARVVPAMPPLQREAKPQAVKPVPKPVQKVPPRKKAAVPKKTVPVVRPKPLPVPEKAPENVVEETVPDTLAEAPLVPDTPPVEAPEALSELPAERAETVPVTAAASEGNARAVQSSEDYLQEHLRVIAALLRENLYYPRIARKRRIEGEVVAKFTVETDGTVSDVTIMRHARAILDRAAIKTIEALSGRLPHPEQTLTLDVPIRFVLK